MPAGYQEHTDVSNHRLFKLPFTTPLLRFSVKAGLHSSVINALLALGANPNSYSGQRQKRTPFHLAVRYERVKIVQVLLKKGAEIDKRVLKRWGNQNETILHFAVYSGKMEMVQALLAAGAYIDASDDNFSTPLHLAVRSGKVEMVQALLAAGAEINASDNKRNTPLHLAVRSGKMEMIQALLAAGADIDARGDNFSTPLHLAVRHGAVEVVQALLAAGARVVFRHTEEFLFERRDPLLHLAVRSGKVEMVQALLAAGADVDMINTHYQTPFYLALDNGNMEIAEALLAAGANRGINKVRHEIPLAEVIANVIKCCLPDLSNKERDTLAKQWSTLIEDENGAHCSHFIELLHSTDPERNCLLRTPEYKDPTAGPQLRQLIGELLQTLPGDPELCQACNAYALEATSSCIDKVILAFRDCVKAVKLAELLKHPTRADFLDRLADMGSYLFKEAALDKIVDTHITKLKNSGKHVDEVEERLAFLTQLSQSGAVQLISPIFCMEYRRTAQANDEQIVAAQQHILKQAAAQSDGGAAEGLATSPQWRSFLEEQRPDVKQRHRETVLKPAHEKLEQLAQDPQMNNELFRQENQAIQRRLEQASQQFFGKETDDFLRPVLLKQPAVVDSTSAHNRIGDGHSTSSLIEQVAIVDSTSSHNRSGDGYSTSSHLRSDSSRKLDGCVAPHTF